MSILSCWVKFLLNITVIIVIIFYENDIVRKLKFPVIAVGLMSRLNPCAEVSLGFFSYHCDKSNQNGSTDVGPWTAQQQRKPAEP